MQNYFSYKLQIIKIYIWKAKYSRICLRRAWFYNSLLNKLFCRKYANENNSNNIYDQKLKIK